MSESKPLRYKINPRSMLFEITDREQRDELLLVAQGIVMTGNLAYVNHPAFQEWCAVCGFTVDQPLLVYATAFPQRLLLSIAEYDTRALSEARAEFAALRDEFDQARGP